MLLSVLTKAFLLFCLGAVLTAFCIVSEIAALPFLAGAAVMGGTGASIRNISRFADFAVPLILYLLGFGFAKWFSLYPLYSMMMF